MENVLYWRYAGKIIVLVRSKRPGTAVARAERASGPLPRLDLGGHAPADARGGRHPVFRALPPDASRHPVACRRGRGHALPALGGARLLFPRPESLARRPRADAVLRRDAARRLRYAVHAPRHRRLYRRRHRVHRLRAARSRRGRQRAARIRAVLFRRAGHPLAVRPARHPRAGGPRAARDPSGGLQSGADGPRRVRLHPERRPALRALSAAGDLRGICGRHGGAAAEPCAEKAPAHRAADRLRAALRLPRGALPARRERRSRGTVGAAERPRRALARRGAGRAARMGT